MPTLYIDQNILKNNINITKKLAKDAAVIGVIKENGYGLGLCTYARLLTECGIEMLAVTDLEDAVALRNSGIQCDILMLSPLYNKKDIATALHHYIILCIPSYECGKAAEETAKELSLYARAHICIDTGLGRYGFPSDHVRDIIFTINTMYHFCVTGIYSHFYASSCKKPYHTKEQFRLFTNLCDSLEENHSFVGIRHIAASCALLKYPETKLDAVRIGSAFLGRLPFPDQWGYVPVGQLTASITDIRTLSAGSGIGYGHTFIAPQKITVAIVPIGYSHGLGIKRSNDSVTFSHIPHAILHHIKNVLFPKPLYAYHQENAYPVVGKIGMNSLAIDITGAKLTIGDTIQIPVNPIYVDSSIPRTY